MTELKLVSSNEYKLNEFQQFGLSKITIERGRDLKEVDSDDKTVIIYKSLDAGINRIVEDTSLIVEGANVGVNVRWLIDHLHEYAGRKAIWKVYLGLNDGENIILYSAEVEGILVESNLNDGFGFDSYFQPLGSDKTLYELEKEGLKNKFSARKKAVENLVINNQDYTVKISDIPVWIGSYQAE